MTPTISFFLLCLFGTTLALYPNPTYQSVFHSQTVVIKPAVEYGVPKVVVPEKVYGLPEVRVPSIVYGAPAKTVVVKTPEKPSETYGVLIIPSTSYGVPVQRVPVPSKTVIDHVLPQSLDLDLDSVTVDSIPSGGDVLPFRTATTFKIYTAPKPKTPTVEYGVPVQEYKLPEVRVPAIEYGVPSQEYGLPQVRVPATTYGLF